jgi:hypothetical protein
MRKSHFTHWSCGISTHEKPLHFQLEEDFVEHMKAKHPKRFREEALPLIARHSLRTRTQIFEACPFCDVVGNELEGHVAEHLRELALLSWPPNDLEEDGEVSCDPLESDKDHSDTALKSVKSDLSDSNISLRDSFDESDENWGVPGSALLEYGFLGQHWGLFDRDVPDRLSRASCMPSEHGRETTDPVEVVEAYALRDDTAVRHKRDLMGWICPVDYHVQHQYFIDRHRTGTGQWFLQNTKFQEWDRSKDATLFCPGIPGAGKTIMAALVIDHLLRSQHVADEPVTFIYCNYKRQSEQSAKHMLSSILRQIIDIQPGVPKLVQEFYTFHTTRRTTPSFDEIEQVIESVSKDLRGLTIIVDALDECETRARQDFLSAVETLRRQCEVRLLATSRPLPTVQFHPIFLGKPMLEVKASDEDLEMYIRSRASELHFRVMSKPDLLEDLITSTIRATGGMYAQPLL